MLCFLPGTNEACGAYSSLHSSLPHCCVQICCSFRLLALFFCKYVLSSFTPLAFTKELGILSCMILVFCSTSSPFGLHYASLHRCPAHPCTMLILHTKQLGWLSHIFQKDFRSFSDHLVPPLAFHVVQAMQEAHPNISKPSQCCESWHSWRKMRLQLLRFWLGFFVWGRLPGLSAQPFADPLLPSSRSGRMGRLYGEQMSTCLDCP